ncbi:DNA-directed RNA polymerase subunit omega [Candidatus Aerophobetes bacterium]|nr:DNA-directed RNA polymerase subunit omega [Candidatus Aerophobetes bacterium]
MALNTYFVNELLKKTGAKDKFTLARLAIQRAKQLIKEKEKRTLLDSEKITTYILREMQEGKIRAQELEAKENKEDSL